MEPAPWIRMDELWEGSPELVMTDIPDTWPESASATFITGLSLRMFASTTETEPVTEPTERAEP